MDAKALLLQTKNFIKTFHVFPKYVVVNGEEVKAAMIVKVVEGILRRTYQYWRRAKRVAQIDDALKILK